MRVPFRGSNPSYCFSIRHADAASMEKSEYGSSIFGRQSRFAPIGAAANRNDCTCIARWRVGSWPHACRLSFCLSDASRCMPASWPSKDVKRLDRCGRDARRSGRADTTPRWHRSLFEVFWVRGGGFETPILSA
jgi:hypothetical protein